VIHPALVHGVDFFPGPYPAMYGRHVGGVIAARTPPPAYRVRGEANIRVFDLGAYLEVPFDEGRGDVFGGGRYSYTAAVLSLFAPNTKLSYWDYQAGGGYHLTPRDRLGLFAFGSDDYLGEIDSGTERELFGAQFHRIDLRLDHAPPRHLRGTEQARREPRTRTGVTLGRDRTGLGEEGVMSVLGFGVRADGEVPLNDWLSVRAGTNLQVDWHEFEPRGEPTEPPVEEPPADGEEQEEDDSELSFDISEAFVPGRTHELGAYVDVVFRPIDELEIVPGLRSDMFSEGGVSKAALDPRGAVRVRPVPWLTTVSAVGVAHQRPALVLAVPGLDPQALEGGLQEVVQVSQGIEFALPKNVAIELTGFVHWYANLTDLSASCGVGVSDCTIADRADGRAYGVEMMIRRSLTERVGGLLAYTLSRAERTVHGRTTLSDYDRTHVVHAAIGIDLGRNWHAGLRLSAYSGRPYSLIAFDDPTDPDDPTLIGRRNALRRPVFHRLDLRIEKRWRFGETAWVSLVLEGMNVTLSKEIVDFDCRVAEALGGRGGLSCGGQEIGPITIPSLGVAGGI
jgi:hypothetical protein